MHTTQMHVGGFLILKVQYMVHDSWQDDDNRKFPQIYKRTFGKAIDIHKHMFYTCHYPL